MENEENNFYFMQETLTTLTDNFGAILEMYAHSFGAISIVAHK